MKKDMKRTAGLVWCLWAALLIPADLEAQGITGRLRKKVEQAVTGEKKAAPARADTSRFFSDEVLEITAPVLNGLINGLDLQIRLLTEFDALLATYRAPEEYERCTLGVRASPEAQKLNDPLMSLPEGATLADVQRITEQAERQLRVLFGKACGPDPAEWPQDERRKKVQEIRVQAAAAAGPVRSQDPPVPEASRGPWVPSDPPALGVLQEKGLTERQKDVLEERIAAYCAYKKLKGDQQFWQPGDGNNLSVSAKAIDPKAGNHYWLFTADEVVELDKQCGTVTLKIGQIVELMDAIYIKGKR